MGNSSFLAAHTKVPSTFSDKRRVAFVELEIAVTATMREGKFRSRLHESRGDFERLAACWMLSPQDPTNVNATVTSVMYAEPGRS